VAITVLVVEDELIIAHAIRRKLIDFGYEVTAVAATGPDALAAAELRVPDLVLMDIRLKGPFDGIETATRLLAKHSVPVVYLTSHYDEATLTRALKTAPYGYIVKPFTDEKLRTSIEIAFARYEVESTASAKASRLAEANLELVTQGGKRESERLLSVARTDPLTEAANRLHLQDDLEVIADHSLRYGHQYCAAFCDIDSFKSYNDSFGHLAGDGAIRAVSREIQRGLRRGDGYYRYGGDEFLVLLPEQSLATAWDCMERVRSAVACLPVATDRLGLLRPVTISVGIADFRITPDQDPIQSWLQRADAALYRAKVHGRNRVQMSGVSLSPLPTRTRVATKN
jgi:two-component system chemotaxis response regulator CheY